jgi:cytochrome c nitrite reductase small subunit
MAGHDSWVNTSALSGRQVRPQPRLRRGGLAVGLMVTLARPASAETLQDFQFDPVEHWAARILVWVLLVSLAAVGYILIRSLQGRLDGIAGKGLLIAGVVLLPSFSVATGMLLVFARAERVEFCGSCHKIMADYVADMTNPSGEGLAALHFKYQYIESNQCYECHTSYGLFGTLEAKMHGVGEVLRYYTGSYDLPLSMWNPYPNGDCLKCHARSSKWLAQEEHGRGEAKRELFDGTTSCMSCHDAAHNVHFELARDVQ